MRHDHPHSARREVAIHANRNAGWSEFHWTFHAIMRQDGSAVTTHGVETLVLPAGNLGSGGSS